MYFSLTLELNSRVASVLNTNNLFAAEVGVVVLMAVFTCFLHAVTYGVLAVTYGVLASFGRPFALLQATSLL